MADLMSEVEWLDIFGDNLRGILEEYGMSQSELAEETYLSQQAISKYINKQSVPSLKAIINIAYVLDISIDELIDFDAMIE